MAQLEGVEPRSTVLIQGLVTYDTALVAVSALGLSVLMLLGDLPPPLQALRMTLGLGFVLFAPGYSLVAALFARAGELDPPARVGLSIGLSIALIPVVTLLLDRLPWGIYPWPILVAELAICGLGLSLAAWQRARLPPGQCYAPDFRSVPLRLVLAWALSAVSVLIFIYGVTAPMRAAPPTEFYILGSGGLAEAYPRQARVGDFNTVTFGLVSHEQAERTFRVEVWSVDPLTHSRRARLAATGPLTVLPGELYTQRLSWQHSAPGADQLVELHLLKAGTGGIFRRLQVWIDVVP